MKYRSDNYFSVQAFAAVLIAFIFAASCATLNDKTANRIANPESALSFSGVIPAADCPGIDIRLDIFPGGRWTVTEVFIDRNGGPFIQSGGTDTDGSVLLLKTAETTAYRFKTDKEGRLRMLDSSGSDINGELAGLYVLSPVEPEFPALPAVEMLLSQLNGETVSRSANPATILFDSGQNRISGSSGCNRYGASFTRDGAYGIVFSGAFSTRMACPDMTLEDGFLEMLSGVNTFRIYNSKLFLYKDNGGPSAVFIDFVE